MSNYDRIEINDGDESILINYLTVVKGAVEADREPGVTAAERRAFRHLADLNIQNLEQAIRRLARQQNPELTGRLSGRPA